MNIVDIIDENHLKWPNQVAISDGDQEMSYAKLLLAAKSYRTSILSLGLFKGHRIGIYCDDSMNYIALSLGVLWSGCVAVPISPEVPEGQVESIVNAMEVSVLIFDLALKNSEDSEPLIVGGVESADYRIKCCLHDNGTFPDSYLELNPAFIRFTSGTTGESKGVLLSHESIKARTDNADVALGIGQGEKVLWVLSMSYHFTATILLFLQKGAHIILAGGDYSKVQEGFSNHSIDIMYGAPFHFEKLIEDTSVTRETLCALRLPITTTMKCRLEICRQFQEKFCIPLVEAYGIIEVGLPFIGRSGGVHLGKPVGSMQCELRGESNIIFLKGPGFFDAYLEPWSRACDMLDDGWFETGDVGAIDAQGNLSITGREKELINYLGMKIFPDEVESVLEGFSDIAQAVVFAQYHEQLGEIPVANVVLRQGCSELDNMALRKYCRNKLAVYKIPKEFEVVDRIQNTPSGKKIRKK